MPKKAKLTQPAQPVARDPITALAALYQGEKTDASALFNTAMAMMGLAVAYLVGVITGIEKLGGDSIDQLNPVLLVLLPFPLWLVIAFHSLMTLNALSHGISVQIIEEALFKASELRVRRGLVGSAAGDKIMDITQARLAHRITTVVVYGGVFLCVLGFTCYLLYSANQNVLQKDPISFPNLIVVFTASVIYSLLWIIVARSWMAGFEIIGEGRSVIRNDREEIYLQSPRKLKGNE